MPAGWRHTRRPAGRWRASGESGRRTLTVGASACPVRAVENCQGEDELLEFPERRGHASCPPWQTRMGDRTIDYRDSLSDRSVGAVGTATSSDRAFEDLTMENDIYLLSSKTMSMLKQRARDLKRNTSMSHTQALDFVALDIGIEHWKGVTEAVARYKPFEQAMKTGLVVAFDRKDSPEPAEPADNLVHWAFGLDPRLREDIRNWWADLPAEYEDDPQGRPNRVVFSEDEIEETCEDMFWGLDVFIVPDIPRNLTLTQSLDEFVFPSSFFSPWFGWLRGHFHSL